MATKKKQTTGNSKTIFILIIIIIGGFVYWSSTNSSSESAYAIKGAGDEGGYRASFINVTGEKNTKDKKIGLSDDYWTGGKFGF